MNNIKNQDFEIISLEHEDYLERMKAIDEINNFDILEEIFITDEYITVRAKAYDRLTKLFSDTKKYEKMIKEWKNVSGFLGWIHFIIENLGKGNNIEKTIRYILEEKRGYPFDDFWYRYYIPKIKNQIFQKVIDVILEPIKSNDYWSRDGFEVRYTRYGIQYHYEMVIKILVENNNELYYEYVYIRCWNSLSNAHKKFYKKINYEGDEK